MTVGVISRSFVRATGDDAQKYLHSQLSNDIASMDRGESRHSLLLEPTGKVVALVRVSRTADDAFLLDFDEAIDGSRFVDTVLARLNRFRIRVKVEFEEVDLTCVAFRDESPFDVDGIVVPAWWPSSGGHDVISASKVIESRASDDVEDLRIAAGWPRMGSEIVPGETLPAATGVVGVAVSFTKGCYPGQELVERMDSRGSVAPRTLRRLTPSEGARPGDDIVVDGHAVGVYTSVGRTVALGLVNRGVDVGESVS